MDAPPSLWIVLDPKDGPEFAAAWREGAHEHIKDCLDEGIHEAARWVVREYVPADENTRLRAEVEALRADVVALHAAIAEVLPVARVYAAKNPPHEYKGVMQDPHGVHAWLAAHDPATITQERT